ncbi:MAG TPA: GNAT family N-acetyltransferase [Fastidiosipila sp.]|nr:GNAT family N-acetyltransferase [Fastidiosipila sp.]
MILNTKRLTLRPFSAQDFADACEIFEDDLTCRYLLHDPWRPDNRERAFAEKLQQNMLTQLGKLSLACLLESKMIGELVFWYTGMRQTVEIGFVFNRAFAGQGYASEAARALVEWLFEKEDVHRIQANLDARNIASSRVCERIGMRREAHFLKDFWNKDEWTDSFVYGMLRTDL